jgi:hypothetical protein
MVDVTNYPDEIWATCDVDVSQQTCDVYAQETPDGFVDEPSKYVRNDLIPDMLDKAMREAYELAAKEVESWQAFTKYAQEPIAKEMADAVRALADK